MKYCALLAFAVMLATMMWATSSDDPRFEEEHLQATSEPRPQQQQPLPPLPRSTIEDTAVELEADKTTLAPESPLVDDTPYTVKAERGPNDLEEWVRVLRGENTAIHVAKDRIRSLVDIRDGSGIPFRDALVWSENDKIARTLVDNALLQSVTSYFDLLADTDTPLPPWKKPAVPITCDGLDYYSGHFSIPEENIVPSLMTKTRDWATVVPGRKETYLFKTEASYRKDLQEARFGITRRRYGFATNRNLEMLAAGCIPYFCGIRRVPPTGTLDSLPKEFFTLMLQFPGLSAKCNPPRRAMGLPLTQTIFNETKYLKLADKLLDYTRQYQTTTHLARYILSATSLKTLPRNVLILWASHYTIFLTGFLHGLRKLGVEVEDVPRRDEVYDDKHCAEAQLKTYAKGWFFFCRTKESPNLSRKNIETRIRERAFDLIVISVTDTLTYHLRNASLEIPFYDAITESYPKDLILALNDADLIKPMTTDVAHKVLTHKTLYFKRETHGCQERIW